MLPEINIQQQSSLNGDSKKGVECEGEEEISLQSWSAGRPLASSMVFKKANRVIPAEVVAEAMWRLHGLDLRWSGPITPAEMQYVEEYVVAKYPEYRNGLSSSSSDMAPSRLSSFMSIPEVQARKRALDTFGLSPDEYLVVFTASVREALSMVGESYPFFRGNYYMSVLPEGEDQVIREVAASKEAKVVGAPAAWLDLRIKGSQLSQYFRRKCKCSPKGLFAYPADGLRSSMHWISEAHRNSWHVLLHAAAKDECLSLALHRPDFVTCTVHLAHAKPSKLTCLLLRRNSIVST